MATTVQELAERAVTSLTANQAEQDQRRQAAQTYVRTLFAAHPKTKLPALLGLAETRELMESHGVSKNMLSTELSLARAELKATQTEEPVKVPKRTRKKRAAASSVAKPAFGVNSASGLLPLSSPPAGRIENGSIADL